MPRRPRPKVPRKTSAELFKETRGEAGERVTAQSFARENLGGSVEHVMLGYIEKGERLPNESVVRRLAALRGEDPRALLAALSRDRMMGALTKELERVLAASPAVPGVDDAEISVRVSQAIAALPDDGTAIPVGTWRNEFRAPPKRQKTKKRLSEKAARRVEEVLIEQELITIERGKVRRSGRHYVATDNEARRSLAAQYCSLFLTGLLDCIALDEQDESTYMRNHYLNIEQARIPEFHKKLDEALRTLAEEFATDRSTDTRFMNVLTTGVCSEDDE